VRMRRGLLVWMLSEFLNVLFSKMSLEWCISFMDPTVDRESTG
jgi:hypothetical protein